MTDLSASNWGVKGANIVENVSGSERKDDGEGFFVICTYIMPKHGGSEIGELKELVGARNG